MLFLATTILGLGFAQAIPPQAQVKDLIKIPVADAAEFQALHSLLTDVDDHQAVAMSGVATAYATDAEQDRLAAVGIPFEVQIEDLASYYAQRAAADLAAQQGGVLAGGPVGSMGGFRTLAEIEQEMDRLSGTYPLLCSPKFAVGTTIDGRTIWGMRISTTPGAHDPSKSTGWYDAIHHAREPMSGESLLMFMDEILSGYGLDEDVTRLIETRNLVFIPCVNPDGYEYNRQTNPGGGGMWRKNRRNNLDGSFGVDLNRNYDWEWGPQWPGSSGNTGSDTYRGTAPFSEPETTALANMMAVMPPGMSMSSHTYSDLMLYPWGYNTIVTPDDDVYRQYGSAFTASNGWPRGTIWQLLYIANGGSVDYHYGQHGTIAFTPEIGGQSDGFWPSPSRITALYASIQPAYLQTAMYTGAWASVGDLSWTEITGDGDPWQEAGESWSMSVNVENFGTDLLSVDLDLSTTNPFLTVSGLPAHLDISPRDSQQGGNWQVDFAGNAPSGQALDMDLQWDFDGWTSSDSVEVTLGRVRVLVRDLMETDDFGWFASNLTNWSWERADPQSTTSGGSEVQAGDDNTANGTLCWVTGAAAGGSVGANDVDGTTMLTSPRFNLTGLSNASLHYARWFANRPGGPVDDRWVSQLSNNNGVSWTDLEDLGDTGSSWVDTEIELDGVLPFTENMRLRFTVADDPNDDITEGLLDDLEIRTLTDTPTLSLWGDASASSTARFVVDGEAGSSFDIAWSNALSGGSTVPGIAGTLYLTAPRPILNGNCGTDGVGIVDVNLPPSVAGLTLHFQGVVALRTAAAEFTTPLSISFQ